ncbi:RagB/SusD family nutrient uptake outer membrane protein [Pedobacter glucosidilyticus]|uniref:RagB/SusD family nutrient uptake outer membrane protein n=1 Tax=Pedobacter glucosidilyticus TaxID=1122941 RepID=UPI0003FFAD74|nr:RagB/SusD family nutrient uptake outer membrane protein [Pedobacter glucosidilyticus]
MKTKIQHILIAISFLVVFASCNSVLDKDPLTEYTYDNFWNEPAQASAALSGAYFRLQSTLNTEFISYGEARADILEVTRPDNVTTLALQNNTLNPDLGLTDWTNFYRVIGQANLIIKNVQEMRAKGLYVNQDAEYNRVLGQALGLRALCYLYMVKVWGAVPLITEPVISNGDINAFKTPRTDSIQVYNQIVADLLRAQPLLPVSYSDARKTRATLTRGGIDAILTDYYMWRNDLDSALVTSARILGNSQYRLANLYDPAIDYLARPQVDIDNTEYAKMFIDGFGPESIFEMAFSFDEGTTSGLISLFGGGPGLAQYFAKSEFASKFLPTDLRVFANFKSDVQIFKMFPKGTFDRVTANDKNVILYRLADIMLMRAEALTLKGDRNGAWALLGKVRERVFGIASSTNNYNNDITGPTGLDAKAAFLALSVQEAHDVILEERQKELCFEGKRWFDLVRTGRVFTTKVTVNNTERPLVVNAENILFPINLNIIRQNPLIEQNNFYK